MKTPQINKVSIDLKPKVYSIFRNLPNTVWNVFGEYVDNSLQSYLDNKEDLFKMDPGYKLRIDISIDWDKTISIVDNAAGIGSFNYLRAFEPANIPTDITGLNEFGMGLKTASIWLADKWRVSTKALGEDVEREIEFDLLEVEREERKDLNVVEHKAPVSDHYTIITLSQLSTNAPSYAQLDKIRRHLSSIYRKFIGSGEVEIYLNEQQLEAPSYKPLLAPFYKNPDGDIILWKKDIDYQYDKYRVKGFIAILDRIQNNANGLVLIRRGRVIAGNEDGRYFPSVLFGQTGGFRYKRLYGELELEGFSVTFNKNGIQEVKELDIMLEYLKSGEEEGINLDLNGFSLLSQAEYYRQRGKEEFAQISKDIKRGLEKSSKTHTLSHQVSEVEGKMKDAKYIAKNEDIIAKAIPLESQTEYFEYNGKKYSITIQTVQEPEANNLYSVISGLINEHTPTDVIPIICKINLAHSFFTRNKNIIKKGEDFMPIVEILRALAIAEIMTPDVGITVASNLRKTFNQNITHYIWK